MGLNPLRCRQHYLIALMFRLLVLISKKSTRMMTEIASTLSFVFFRKEKFVKF